MNKFYGTGVAMVTPFKADGSVDYNGLENLIQSLIDGGIDYLVSLGTTGESATLTKEEKKQIWKFTADTVGGKIPLVAGIGGNNTQEVIADLNGFEYQKYDAVLSVCPYYNKPTQAGIYQHYKAIASVSPLPVILYNVPGRTGISMTAETTSRLAHDCDNIIATKEASGNFELFNQILRDKPEDFLFISGDDPVTLPLIAMGAAGIISVVGNAMPKQLSDMVNLCLKGDFKSARPIHNSLLEITRLCFAEGNPAGVKSILKLLGICDDEVRLPLVKVGDTTYQAIRAELDKLQTVA